MTGKFVISLDCEGKWGMADHIGPEHDRFLTEDNLNWAYARLLDLFARYDMPATFAFVMAFTLSPEEYRVEQARLRDVMVEGANWLRHFRAAESAGRLDGWFAPRAFDNVRRHEQHEIGCHGFCHAPLDEASIGDEDAQAELDSAASIARMKGLALKTFVFPRNQVGRIDRLREHGYVGYREKLSRRGGVLGRVASLGAEFNIFEGAQKEHPPARHLTAIPPGHFFNWRHGVRALVPKAATVRRWRAMLDDAATSGGVVHLWTHPHNMITGPETLPVLDEVISYAARLRDSGRIECYHQAAYCAATEAIALQSRP